MKHNNLQKLGMLLVMLIICSIFAPALAVAGSSTVSADEYYAARQEEYAKLHIQVTTYGYDKDEVFTIDELNAELERIRASVDQSNYNPELDAFMSVETLYNSGPCEPIAVKSTPNNQALRAMPVTYPYSVMRTVNSSLNFESTMVLLVATVVENAQNNTIMEVSGLTSFDMLGSAYWVGTQSGNYYNISGTNVSCFYPGTLYEYKTISPGVYEQYQTSMILGFVAKGASGSWS